MPIVELFGREYAIPYDPERIAGLLYKGIKVFPDDDVDEEQISTEQQAINGHLHNLWKDDKLRTVPSGRQTRDFSPPSIDEGMTAGKEHFFIHDPRANGTDGHESSADPEDRFQAEGAVAG